MLMALLVGSSMRLSINCGPSEKDDVDDWNDRFGCHQRNVLSGDVAADDVEIVASVPLPPAADVTTSFHRRLVNVSPEATITGECSLAQPQAKCVFAGRDCRRELLTVSLSCSDEEECAAVDVRSTNDEEISPQGVASACGENKTIFGKRSSGGFSSRHLRTSDCLVLEPSEMIVVDYPNFQSATTENRSDTLPRRSRATVVQNGQSSAIAYPENASFTAAAQLYDRRNARHVSGDGASTSHAFQTNGSLRGGYPVASSGSFVVAKSNGDVHHRGDASPSHQRHHHNHRHDVGNLRSNIGAPVLSSGAPLLPQASSLFRNSHGNVLNGTRPYESFDAGGVSVFAENEREIETVIQRSEVYDAARCSRSVSASSGDFSNRVARHAPPAAAGTGVVQVRTNYWQNEQQQDDFDGLPEAIVDSEEDDNESVPSGGDSLVDLRDLVRDCLERDPCERSDDDIQQLYEFMHHMPSFANLPQAVKRELCSKMVFAVVEKRGTIVLKDNELLDSWCVIVNGEVEIVMPGEEGARREYHLGDSFGVEPRGDEQYHRGFMRTLVDDCQFVLVAQPDYVEIMGRLRENVRKHTDSAGEVVSETERRTLANGSGEGYVMIKARPEKLVQALVEERDANVDPYYVDDFLLVHRTFMPKSTEVFARFLAWFAEGSALRDKVARLVLLWVNNHFNDFETDAEMMRMLEEFESGLQREEMPHHQQLLNIACSVKSRARTVTYTRSNREEILHFSILGGHGKGYGIFVSKVEVASQAEKVGLKRGDQILEVNNQNFQDIQHQRALEILRGSTHLSITVKSNLLSFKEMLALPDRVDSADGRKASVVPTLGGHSNSAIVLPHFPHSPHLMQHVGAAQRGSLPSSPNGKKPPQPASPSGSFEKPKTKLEKIFDRIKHSSTSKGVETDDDQTDSASFMVALDPSGGARRLRPSHSNPDISAAQQTLVGGNGIVGGIAQYYQPVRAQCPEHVLKIYRADQSYKYVTVYKETPAENVVQLALQEFGMTNEASGEFVLAEVSVGHGGLIKQRQLPPTLQNLAERLALNSRYYLKNLKSSEQLVTDELAATLLGEAETNLMQLSANIVAAQLTLQDFAVFASIEQTEYIDNLFRRESKYGWPKLEEFEQLVNKETNWVATEICNEKNVNRRAKLIKKFIQIAKHCKDCKNFNGMFAILSGLEKPSIARMHNSWDKVSNKYKRVHEDLKLIIDPSRNMSKYRQLLHACSADPPVVPLFPILKKDLTFIHEGNKTWIDGMVNFEKLRMIAKEVRSASKLASAPYELCDMFENTNSGRLYDALYLMNNSERGNVATMRKRQDRGSAPGSVSRKKLYDQALMVRRVKSYLSELHVIESEQTLDRLSAELEPQANAPANVGGRPRPRQSSPSPSSISSLSADSRRFTGPKFGAESPLAVQKLMSLAENSRVQRPVAPSLKHAGNGSVSTNSLSAAGAAAVVAYLPASTSASLVSPQASRRRQFRQAQTAGAAVASGSIGALSLQQPGQHYRVPFIGGRAMSSSDATAPGVFPVDLTAESSSVTTLLVPREAAGPTTMVHAASCDSTDSGHASLDTFSVGNSSSGQNSPPTQRRSYPPPPPMSMKAISVSSSASSSTTTIASTAAHHGEPPPLVKAASASQTAGFCNGRLVGGSSRRPPVAAGSKAAEEEGDEQVSRV